MRRQTDTPKRGLVIISTMVVALVLLLPSAVSADGPVQTISYEVEAGDTLWDIAADLTEPGEDIRATVSEIKRSNGLAGSLIVPGQVLTVPAS